LPSLWLLLCVAALLTLALSPPDARAASTIWRVRRGGPGSCTPADPNCASIQAAVNAATAGDTIQVAAGTYPEKITIAKDLTITGAGAAATTVDGTQSGGVFTINAGTVSLSAMTISNGLRSIAMGGGGGGIFNAGTLTVTQCIITRNAARPLINELGFARGGGIYNSGTLTVTLSTISNNGAAPDADEFGGVGGGISNAGTLTVAWSTISGNTARSGGGIGTSGTLILTNSSVSNNTAARSGGGITGGGTITVTDSTVSNNKALDITEATGTIGGGIQSSGALTVAGSTISGNFATLFGGGIYNFGTLTVTKSAVSGNRLSEAASIAPQGSSGGGIYHGSSTGVATIADSIVSDNRAVISDGGGIFSSGKLEVTNSTVFRNMGRNGAGIFNRDTGTLTIDGSSVNNNTALSIGAGISNSGTLTINGSTVNNNYGFMRGGGISNSGTANLVNDTFSTNDSRFGGGVHNSGAGALAVTNCTFSYNLAGAGAGINNEGTTDLVNSTLSINRATSEGGGGVRNSGAGVFRLKNSIVAGNLASAGPDLNGAFSSLGHNFIGSNGEATGFTHGNGGDIVGTTAAPVDPRLFPSGNYGGTTQSFAPRPDSPARDAGDDSVLSAPLQLTTDQRGLARKVGTHVDIGSVEANGAESEVSLIQFGSALYRVAERGGAVIINVRRTGPTTQTASVGFAIVDKETVPSFPCEAVGGNASSRCDYEATSGTLQFAGSSENTLQFAASEDQTTFTVLVNDDAFAEGTETVRLVLSDPTGGAALGPQSIATLEITDDPAEGNTNPVDDPIAFVSQHYRDFLAREPDTSGLNFWMLGIESCGADTACREVKRIDTSAAFFFSIEFKETSFLVYRTYKAAYGNLPNKPVPLKLSEFTSDAQQIGQGVVVNSPSWEGQLEWNKQDYFNSFVTRARFTSAYPTTLSPAQFVDMLFANAGVAPTAAERQAAIGEFGNDATSANATLRGRALRRVAENATLAQQEFNRAFVLAQYFGYLRRDPDAAPDADFSGYNFWLTKLNQSGGNHIAAELVKAFVTSLEYRQRFGTP
jgi:hypothetical protein